ncbi:MAG: hypothetical protein ACE5D2_07890 [Fidelibacterota bacterium]
MRRFLPGFLTGILLTTAVFMTMGATTQVEDDSLKTIMARLDSYLQGELAKEHQSGRYQLQSFQIERTHWHYLLDTATGELYRLEPSRTPGNAKWILTAGPNFEK